MKRLSCVFGLFAIMAFEAAARDTVTIEPEGDAYNDAYNYVSHYSIDIAAPAEDVWASLIDLGRWMDEFAMTVTAGEPGIEGAVYQLYPDQDFHVQITQSVPNTLLVLANLPSTFREEFSTGVAVISLHEASDVTHVALTMSRRYTWQGESDNAMLATRRSEEFSDTARELWQERFLGNLKALAESS